ncbi:MAG: hypothetical protein IH626_08970, partial [Rhodospirillales bacterium]|nr:hypothetical protein [Rhodospirillales bacterium]
PPAAPAPKAPIDLAALAPLAPTSSAVLVAAMPDAGRAEPATVPQSSRHVVLSGTIPAVAPAGEDGWFNQSMLAALERYQDAQRLHAKADGSVAAAIN